MVEAVNRPGARVAMVASGVTLVLATVWTFVYAVLQQRGHQ